MLHPATELRLVDPTVGYGVFATAPIPAGTATWVLDPLDQVLEPAQFARLEPRDMAELEKYSWLTPEGRRILCWDFGKYMNHSCFPNSMSVGGEFEVAIRDIKRGQQLTNDYATLNLERPFACLCGEAACRGAVQVTDVEQLAAEYDELIEWAIRLALDVSQPLLPWLRRQALFEGLAYGGEPIPSILSLRFLPAPALVAPWRGSGT